MERLFIAMLYEGILNQRNIVEIAEILHLCDERNKLSACCCVLPSVVLIAT